MSGGARVRAIGTVLCVLAAALRAESVVWTEATEGEPGEVVTVVVKATTIEPIKYAEATVGYDPAVFAFVGRDFAFSPAAVGAESVGGVEFPAKACVVARIYVDMSCPTVNSFPATEIWELVRFYFRVRSAAQPGDHAMSVLEAIPGLPSGTGFVSNSNFSLAYTIVPGTARVTPATRPLPPDLSSCAQELRAVRVQWKNAAAYDSLLLERDGAPLGELAGTAVSYVDEAPSLGTHTYALTGRVGTDTTLSVACSLEVGPPEVEPVRAFTCVENAGGVDLAWDLADDYGTLEVRRNGLTLDIIDGTASRYRDNESPVGTQLYEILAYVGNVASSPAPCVLNGTWVLRLGSVEVPAGTRHVTVPMYLSFPEPIQGFEVAFAVPERLFRVTGWNLDGTVLAAHYPFILHEVIRTDYTVFAGEFFGPNGGFQLAPAIEASAFKIEVELAEDVAPGTVIPLTLRDDLHTPELPNVLIANGSRTVFVEKLSGEIVVGAAAVPPVKGLSVVGEKSKGSVQIAWRNGRRYDSIEVERNGTVIEVLNGDAERVTDAAAAAGSYWYRVRGIAQGVPSPWKLVVHTALPGVTLFRRGDANADSRVDLADAIRICTHLFAGARAGCQDALDTNDDGALDVADAVYLLSYLFRRTEAPPSPGPFVRWFDGTPDALGCAEGTP